MARAEVLSPSVSSMSALGSGQRFDAQSMGTQTGRYPALGTFVFFATTIILAVAARVT